MVIRILPEGEPLPSLQEILDQLDAMESFYRSNPDIQKIKIRDYMTLLPKIDRTIHFSTPSNSGKSFMTLFDECRREAARHKVVFL